MPFDLLIVTCRDRAQQWLFQQRLREIGSPLVREVLVVPDPEGPQPGSGGSTLTALTAALDHFGGRWRPSARVLVVHCAGLSQRVPQFSHLGKAFAPTGEGEEILLPRIVAALHALTEGFPPGVTLACGDIRYEAAAQPYPADAHAVAWTWSAPLRQASAHGVYLWDRLTGRCLEALQKPSPEEMRAHGLRDEAPLDTGILFLRPAVVRELLRPYAPDPRRSAFAQLVRSRVPWRGLHLYQHVAASLCRPVSCPFPNLDRLTRFGLSILQPESARFEHFGTTRELLHAYCPTGRALQVNSLVTPEEEVAERALVLHHCRLDGGADLGAGSFSVGLRSAARLAVRESTLAFQLPVRREGRAGEAVVALGIEDDPQAGVTLMGLPLAEWAADRKLPAEAEFASLWEAPLFPVVRETEVPRALAWLQEGGNPPEDAELLSIREIRRAWDPRRWWRHESRLRAAVTARRLARALEQEPDIPLAELVRDLPASLAPAVLKELEALARPDRRPLVAARVWRLCASVAGERDLDAPHHREAYAAIERGIFAAAAPPRVRRWALPAAQEVPVAAPVRVDLAGGWTDTPPQACELGGRVLNLALDFGGQLPVRARARVLAEPEIRLRAEDLGVELRCRSVEELLRHQDLRDPFSLHKAALVEAGVIHARVPDLTEHLRKLGGGLFLQTDVWVPKGSGLGTSSILGAVVMAALHRLTNQSTDWEELFQAVLRLEQRMTTGGGWQDQVGGLLPGVKLTRTAPGMKQVPVVQSLTLSPQRLAELDERMVLFYTGLPRLAKNVLKRVVDHFLARDAGTLEVLLRMRALAEELAPALEAGEWETVGHAIDESWELNKRLEPTASNPDIERLFTAARPFIHGAKLAGAGGGGFMFALARTREDAGRLSETLLQLQPTGRIVDAHLAQQGLTV